MRDAELLRYLQQSAPKHRLVLLQDREKRLETPPQPQLLVRRLTSRASTAVREPLPEPPHPAQLPAHIVDQLDSAELRCVPEQEQLLREELVQRPLEVAPPAPRERQSPDVVHLERQELPLEV